MENNRLPKAFLFDLDGTLYLEDEVIPGAREVLQWVREIEAEVRFVTNNPREDRHYHVEKLNGLGLEANLDEIVTAALVTTNYLKDHPEYGEVFVLGEKGLQNKLTSAGITLVDHDEADTVLISFDTTLTYERLLTAFHALQKGARFIATNIDPVCPSSDGGLVDAGALIAALEKSTGRKVEKVFGKPSKMMTDLILDHLNITPEECVMTGDRLHTDIKMADQAGMIGAWINAEQEDLPKDIVYQPDVTIASVAELPEAIKTFIRKRESISKSN